MSSIRQAPGTDKSACDCTCPGTGGCEPICVWTDEFSNCTICLQDVVVNLATAFEGVSSLTLHYVPASGDWQSDCIATSGGRYFHGTWNPFVSPPSLGFGVSSFSVCFPDNLAAVNSVTVLDWDCSGFSVAFDFTGTFVAPSATVVGTPTTSVCCRGFSVAGCSGVGLDGAFVQVWVDSTKTTLLASGFTSGGSVTLCFDGSPTFYREVSHSRFDTLAGTIVLAVGDTQGDVLTPSAGYHCGPDCGEPIADTLHATHPRYGAIVFTRSGVNWVSVVSYFYPGVGSCGPPGIRTITCTWDGSTGYTESWKYNTVTNCPDDSGTGTETATWGFISLDCPPSLSATFGFTATTAIDQALYNATPMTLTITE